MAHVACGLRLLPRNVFALSVLFLLQPMVLLSISSRCSQVLTRGKEFDRSADEVKLYDASEKRFAASTVQPKVRHRKNGDDNVVNKPFAKRVEKAKLLLIHISSYSIRM